MSYFHLFFNARQPRRDWPGHWLVMSLAAVLAMLALNWSASPVAANAPPPFGALTQLPVVPGCISESGGIGPPPNFDWVDECLAGRGLRRAGSSAESPDGKNVYVASWSDAIAVFNRDPRSSTVVTQPDGEAGCISEKGKEGCAKGRGLRGAQSIAISPDGKNVYVAANGSDAITVFNRDSVTGALTQPGGEAGCISEDGKDGCGKGRALSGAWSLSVSPDGRNVYVASHESNAIAVLRRDSNTGELAQASGRAGCISEGGQEGCLQGRSLTGVYSLALAPDGRNVYVTSWDQSSVAVLQRDTESGALRQPEGEDGCVSDYESSEGCKKGRALDGAWSVTASPDGENVYIASWGSDAVSIFKRAPGTGALSQADGFSGCISDEGKGNCTVGRALDGPLSIASSPDGKTVYVGSLNSDAVAILKRTPGNGDLTQPTDSAGCISSRADRVCSLARGINQVSSVSVGPGGDGVYVTASGNGPWTTGSGSLAIFRRDAGSGEIAQIADTTGCVSKGGKEGCTEGKGLSGATTAVVSPDGKNVYAGSQGHGSENDDGRAVTIFRRDPVTGGLALPADAGSPSCINSDGSNGCGIGRGLDSVTSVTVSPDGKNVYVASRGDEKKETWNFFTGRVAIFKRDPQSGALKQLDGQAGCLSTIDSVGCQRVRGLAGATSVTVSPDGKSVYVTSLQILIKGGMLSVTGRVAIFKRDSQSGALTQLAGKDGCINTTVDGENCQKVRGMFGAASIALSPGGNSAYVVSQGLERGGPVGSVVIFKRDPQSGALKQLAGKAGCLSNTGNEGKCVKGRALLSDVMSATVSPDSKNVYTVSESSAVAIFARDTASGAIGELKGRNGCISEPGSYECAKGRGLRGAQSIVISPDGKNVYVAASSGTVTAFQRDLTRGTLSQLSGSAGCISYKKLVGCATGMGLWRAVFVAVSPDNKNVYTAAHISNAVAAFKRGCNQASPGQSGLCQEGQKQRR